MMARVAIFDGARAGGVVCQHAAYRADAAAGRVGRKATSDLRQSRVEACPGHARLHAHRVGADFDYLSKVLAEIDNETRAQRFARQSSSRPARDEGDALLLRVSHEAAHVFLIPRQDDAGRLDLKDAG